MWKFVEIIKGKEPFTARKLAGFPVKYGWKEVPEEAPARTPLVDVCDCKNRFQSGFDEELLAYDKTCPIHAAPVLTPVQSVKVFNESSEAILTQPSAEQLKHAINVIMSTTEPMCRRSPDICQGLPDKPSCPECAEREAVLCAIGYSAADEKWSEAERPVLPVPPDEAPGHVPHVESFYCKNAAKSGRCQMQNDPESAPAVAAINDPLLNLLAVIHRDGGHYIAEHGLEKAVEDAEKIIANHNAASPAVAGRTQGDAEKFFYGESGEPWMYDDSYGPMWRSDMNKAVFQFATEYAALCESVREAPSDQVSNVVQAAESLLEWLPTCSRGSSGYSRRQTLEIALERLREASPEAPAALKEK